MPNYSGSSFVYLGINIVRQWSSTVAAKSFCKSTNKDMAERMVEWSDLPKELVPCIGKSIDTAIDVLRFRSVCASWRSSIPSSREIFPSLPLPFPYPCNTYGGNPCVSQSTIYRLEPSDGNPSPLAYSPSKGWLIRVEESEPGKVRLLNPLSGLHVRFLPDSFPKVVNLLDLRFIEVSKAYKLQYSGGVSIPGVNKVMFFPNSAWTCAEDSLIFALYHEGKLGYSKYGDEKWTLVDDKNFHYDDIILYKEQFYVVDRWGTISWIDSSLKLIQFSPPLCGLGSQKHLVESCGELYVVDRYFLRGRRPSWFPDDDASHNPLRRRACPRTVDFKVYKLDQEWGTWVDVKCLGDRMFILGNDCSFSVSSREFAGCKGNCIFFTDENDIGVFYLEDRSIGKILNFPVYSHLFWPPPSWVS